MYAEICMAVPSRSLSLERSIHEQCSHTCKSVHQYERALPMFGGFESTQASWNPPGHKTAVQSAGWHPSESVRDCGCGFFCCWFFEPLFWLFRATGDCEEAAGCFFLLLFLTLTILIANVWQRILVWLSVGATVSARVIGWIHHPTRLWMLSWVSLTHQRWQKLWRWFSQI